MFGIEDFSKSIVDYSNFDISQLGEAALFGGAILLIGMLAIFAVLITIWICLALFKVAFQGASKPKEAPVQAPVVVTEVPEVTPNAEDEIVAVIAAAIAMAESESSGIKFKVVSFKRK